MKKNEVERVKPITIRNKATSEEYVLEFDKESVKFAEDRGFRLADLDNFPMSKIPEFFFYAFRKHHKNVARNKTDKILEEDLGGVSSKLMQRLIELYSQPFEEMVADEEAPKNPDMEIDL